MQCMHSFHLSVYRSTMKDDSLFNNCTTNSDFFVLLIKKEKSFHALLYSDVDRRKIVLVW